MTGYATVFRVGKYENYNLLLAKWKILNIIGTQWVFEVEKSFGYIKFAVQQPRDRIHHLFLAGKHEILKNSGVSCHVIVGNKILTSPMDFPTPKTLLVIYI